LEAGAKTPSLARTVVTGAGLIALAGGISRLFSLVTSPILTRLLGPSPYGVVALLGTVTSFATMIAMLGVDLSYARYCLAAEVPEQEASVERFCWRFAVGMASLASVAAGGAWWGFSRRMGLPADLAVMVAAGIFLPVVSVMATTRQRMKGAYLRIASSIIVAGGVGAVIAIVLALLWRRDAWALLVGTAVGVGAGAAIAGLPRREILTRGSGLSRSFRWDVVRLGLSGVVMASMYWLMSSADRWFIGMWQGQGPLGIYAFASNVGVMGILLNNAIVQAWFPEMYKTYEASREEAAAQIGRLWARLAVFLMIVWVAVSAVGGDMIKLLAAASFHGGTSYVPWVAGGVFFYGITDIATTGLAIRMDLKPVAAWWAIGAAANVGLNFFLVRAMGAKGAAVSACLSFALIAAGAMRSSQKRYYLPIPWKRLSAAAGLALAAGAGMSIPWSGSAMTSLCMKLPVGIGCAAALIWAVAPDWASRLLRGEFSIWPPRAGSSGPG
jgi:O-antigen/teichoic acid export membrane protein